MFKTEDYKKRKVSAVDPGTIYNENNIYQTDHEKEYSALIRPSNSKTPNDYISINDRYIPRDPIYPTDTPKPSEDKVSNSSEPNIWDGITDFLGITSGGNSDPSEEGDNTIWDRITNAAGSAKDKIFEFLGITSGGNSDPSGEGDVNDKKTYQDMYNIAQSYIDEYLNREGFSYDVNADELYKTFRQQALAKAEASRRDATARAAGLTGGYGSTYAGAVGNAAFDSAMEPVDEIIPELYDAAYSRYQKEGEDLLNKASLADQMGDKLYSEEQAKIKAENQAKEDQKAADDEAYAAIIDPEGPNKKIISALRNYSTPQGQAKYLASQILLEGETKETHPWKLTEAEANELMAEYGLPMIEESTWELVKDGGLNNVFTNIDNDAVVRNEHGQEFTLEELTKELEKYMTYNEARDYILKLQETLGI